MWRLALHDKSPRRPLIEVLAEILIRSAGPGNPIRAAGNNQLGDRPPLGREFYRFKSKRTVSWIGGNDRQDAVGSILREPSNQRPRSGKAQQNQFACRQPGL